MKLVHSSIARLSLSVAVLASASQAASAADATVVYRCPGNEYSNSLTAKEAKDKNCKVVEGSPITVIQGYKPKPVTAGAPAASSPSGSRIDPAEQRARDSDARRILESELKREEERLAAMKIEYNNGEPERLGNERNYQKYQERVADMKQAITRKESDIAALKREISKQPS